MRSVYFIIFLSLMSIIGGCVIEDYQSDSKPISHSTWDKLLAKHISADGLVNYKGLIADSSQVKQYLQLLSDNHPNTINWSIDERKAYWINAYNAFTIKTILDNYPVISIKSIKLGIPFINTIWDVKNIKIENATYDLNNLEHGILRRKFNDPRIHFAINCASISCPDIANHAYTSEHLNEQLDEAAKRFINNPSKNKITSSSIQLSKIFKWYKDDFTTNTDLINYLNNYSEIKIDGKLSIDYMDYNWRINESQ